MRRRAMLTGSSAALLTKTAIGQDWRANTLRFVPLANLSVLDPDLVLGRRRGPPRNLYFRYALCSRR